MSIIRHGFRRSQDVKEVVHIRASKCSGYFESDSKRFAVDPQVTTYADLCEILVNAFNLTGIFNVSYLCRDDKGENIYISLHTEWDLDAAFLTSSDPYLILKVELDKCQERIIADTKIELSAKEDDSSNSFFGFSAATGFQVPRAWTQLAESAIAKITSGIGQNLVFTGDSEETSFFPKKPPLGDCELHKFLDSNGCLVQPEDMRLRIYYGGVEPSLRKVVWRLLLNIFPDALTAQERVAYMKTKTKQYHALYMQWKSCMENKFIQELKKMIWKDVLRTDRTHSYFSGSDSNPHLISLLNILLTYALTHEKVRYCQGMSDIAAPILMVMNNEPHAYVCFCGAMNRLASNFDSAGEVMLKKFEHLSLLLKHHDPEYFELFQLLGADNMYFCYRWLLLEMKREFSFDDALLVLEVMWSSLPPEPPENDLDLGTINLMNEERTYRDSRDNHIKTKQRNSLPNLTLSVKNLPTAIHIGASYGSLKNISIDNDRQSKTQNDIPSYCKNLFPQVSNMTQYLPQNVLTRHEYESIPNSDPCDVDDCDGITLGYNRDTFFSHSKETNFSLLPPPEEFGCGNPFLLFVCLSVLLDEKDDLMNSNVEYADLVMHFDKLVRKHSPARILSQAMQLFASYLRAHSTNAVSTS